MLLKHDVHVLVTDGRKMLLFRNVGDADRPQLEAGERPFVTADAGLAKNRRTSRARPDDDAADCDNQRGERQQQQRQPDIEAPLVELKDGKPSFIGWVRPTDVAKPDYLIKYMEKNK